MKRLVFISDAAYEGGAERYLVRLGGAIDRKSFEPVLLLPDRPGLDRLAAAAAAARIEVRRYSPGDIGRIGGPIAIQSELGRMKPDIAHLNLPSTYDLSCGMQATLARAAGARAVVSTEHIVDILPSRRRAVLKRLSLLSVDRVIAISARHREILETRHGVPGSKIRVVLNGVEDPGKPAPRHADVPRIVCVGTLEKRKGQDILIDALATLLRDGIKAELVLVGDGPDREILESRARSAGLAGPWIRFTGRLESAWQELARAEIVAIPSRHEGIPFTAMEGMAAGAAVIVAALPGIGEIIDNRRTGIIAPIDDVKAWAHELAALIADRDLRVRLGTAARQQYEKRFTVERMAKETEEVYREILA